MRSAQSDDARSGARLVSALSLIPVVVIVIIIRIGVIVAGPA